MKRLLLLVVLVCYYTGATAQDMRASQGNPLMEVNAYMAYLRSSEAGSRNLNSNSSRLEKLLKEVQPAVYYQRGEVKNYGERPTALYTNVVSLRDIASAIDSKESIEIATINVDQMAELNNTIDLSVFSSFPNLKYIYIISTVETSGAAITRMIRNSNERYGVFYKIDKGS